MMVASLVAAGLAVLQQKGLLDELAVTREIRPKQVRRYWFRAETTEGLDKNSAEYLVSIRTLLVDKSPNFRVELSNLVTMAGESRMVRQGRLFQFVTPAEATGWIGQPSFGEGLGSIGFALAGLYLPKIGNNALQQNLAFHSLDGSQLMAFNIKKESGWPVSEVKIDAKKDSDTGFLWLKTKFRRDGWPDWCDGNWQMGEKLIVFRLERR